MASTDHPHEAPAEPGVPRPHEPNRSQQQGQPPPQHRGSFASAPRGTQTTNPATGQPFDPSEEPMTQALKGRQSTYSRDPREVDEETAANAAVWWPDGVPGEIGSAPDTAHRGHGEPGEQYPQPDQSGQAPLAPEQEARRNKMAEERRAAEERAEKHPKGQQVSKS